MASNALKYKIEVLDKASKELKQIAKEMGILDGKAQKSKPSLEDMGRQLMKFAKGGIIGAAVIGGVRAMKRTFDDLTSAYEVQRTAEIKLEAALRATGGALGISKSALMKYAAEMSRTTGIADETIIQAQALMTTFTQIGRDTFPQAIEAAADMSKMFGQDLQQSVIQLGTALNDPIAGVGRLKRIGISFTEEQRTMIKGFVDQNRVMDAQKVILDELNAEFGGVTDLLGQDGITAMQNYKNAVIDLKEQLGKSWLEATKPMTIWLTNLVKGWADARKELNDYKDAQDRLKTGKGSTDDALVVAQKELKDLQSRLDSGQIGGNTDIFGMEDLNGKLREQLEAQISAKKAEIRAIQTAISAELMRQNARTEEEKKEAERQQKIADINKKYVDQWHTMLSIQESLKSPLQKQADDLLKQIESIQLAWSKGSKYENERLELLEKLNSKYQEIIKQIEINNFKKMGFVTDEEARAKAQHDFALSSAGTPHGGSSIETPTTPTFLQNIIAGIEPLVGMFMEMVPSISSINKLLNPLQTILDGVFSVIAPVIDNLLKPLVGILRIVGVTIGRILVPVLNRLTPIIDIIGKAFVWLYNYAIRPFGNFVIWIITSINNMFAKLINGVINLINKIPGINIKWRLPTMSYEKNKLTKISENDLDAYGSDAMGATSGSDTVGAGASYTAGRSTTVNVVVNTEVIAGDAGIRDLALMIRNEISAAEALGY